ncbi:hypothetical protein C8R47DRAFT_1228876 [Mycena vitilis]|nr:hypothetical protein C8R47DRAFT_1228876 [Mycena vitilis]
MAKFHDLGEDILFVVLRRCDVCTVLSASRINKQIRLLALSKFVWLALVTDLIARYLIDFLSNPDFAKYSAAQLRGMVERALCGPAWAKAGARSPPEINRQVSVQSSYIAPSPGCSLTVKLLPGGRFFTLQNHDGGLECWSVALARCIWSDSRRWLSHRPYAADVVDDGKTARFLVPGSSERSFKIVQVDLGTGITFDIFERPPGVEIGDWWMIRDAVLSGDFLVLTLNVYGVLAVLLLNWRESTYLLFHQTLTVPGMAIIPGYIILGSASPDPPHRPVLLGYTLASLAPHWRPFAARSESESRRLITTRSFDLHRIQQGDGIVPAFMEYFGACEGWQIAPERGIRCRGETGMQLTVRESLLHRGSYDLTFVVSERGAFQSPKNNPDSRVDRGAILVAYRISGSFPALRPRLQLMQLSAVPISAACKARNVPNARYLSMIEGVEDINLHRRASEGRNLVGRCNCDSIHLSPYSGAVTTLVGSSVTVSYYL